MNPVRWGFLGAGFVASAALAPAVHTASGAQLRAVGARDRRRAAALDPVQALGSYRAVVESPDVDVVYVALPNDDHLPWVLAALAAGKHVLCEKPLGLDADEVRQVDQAARAAGRWAVEATWYRWHPRALRSRDLVRDGAIGDPTAFSSAFCFGGVPPGSYRLDPRRGGGAWYDVGCYAVSAAHLLLGQDAGPFEVETADRRTGPTGVDLETRATLRSSRGARAELLAGIDAPEHQEVTVHGDLGSLTWSAPQLTSWRQPASLTLLRLGSDPVVEHFAAVDAYRLMVEQVGACARGEEEPVVGLQESWRVAATMDAVALAASARPA